MAQAILLGPSPHQGLSLDYGLSQIIWPRPHFSSVASLFSEVGRSQFWKVLFDSLIKSDPHHATPIYICFWWYTQKMIVCTRTVHTIKPVYTITLGVYHNL